MSSSCVKDLTVFLLTNRISVSIDGTLSRIIHPIIYRHNFLKLCTLILITIITYYLNQIPYYHVTIMGNFIYSKVIAQTVSNITPSFIYSSSNNRHNYYETENCKFIPFEGPSSNSSVNIPNNKLTQNDIIKLSRHSKINNLKPYYLTDLSVKSTTGPILYITKFTKDVYYVSATNHTWFTKVIFSDIVLPLKPGDYVGNYFVDNNYNIIGKETRNTDGIYHLKQVRSHKLGNIIMIHPFHFNETSNWVAAISSVVAGILLSFKE